MPAADAANSSQFAAQGADPIAHLAELLQCRAAESPDQTFLKATEVSVTFAQANQESNRIAHGLRKAGVRSTEPVGIMLPNSVEYVVTWLALSKLGAPVAGISTAIAGQVLAATINSSTCRVLVADSEYLPALGQIAPSLPSLETIVIRGASPAHVPETFAKLNVIRYDDLRTGDTSDPHHRGAGRGSPMLLHLWQHWNPEGLHALTPRRDTDGRDPRPNLALTASDVPFEPLPPVPHRRQRAHRHTSPVARSDRRTWPRLQRAHILGRGSRVRGDGD